MFIPLWFAILFGLSIGIGFLLILIAFKKYVLRTPREQLPTYVQNWPEVVPGKYDTNHAPDTTHSYSILTRMISGLGNLLYQSAPYFNTAVKLFGIMGCVLGYYIFFALLPPTDLLFPYALTILGFIAFEIGSLGIFLLGFFTENRHFKHGITAGLAFGGYLLAIVLWIYPVWLSSIIPRVMIIFHVIPLFFMVLHMKAVRHFDLHTQIQDVLPPNWKENYNLSEWTLFFSVFFWIFLWYLIFVF